ncbi:hypothetical protein QO189_05015 [Psychrobacter sp. Arc29]|uniref:hypothetical protein n=1 Tax=Psychrobacter sp. Arc29 TaxID=3046690 RepID=UPI00352E883E
MSDLLIKNARLANRDNLVNISINGSHIESIDNISEAFKNNDNEPTAIFDAKGNFVCSGFFESHIHLDKACILNRCTIAQGDLDEAVEETSKAKADFTEADVFERASKVIEMAIKKGTVGLRSFVKTDLKTEMRAFNAIKKARDKYAFAIDIEICAFAQSGLTNAPHTYELLKLALSQGADLVGGCPYKDDNPNKHIEMVFDLAEQFNVDVDFHLDFDLDPKNSSIPKLVEETIKRHYQGRVSIGHVTKLSAMDKDKRTEMAALL